MHSTPSNLYLITHCIEILVLEPFPLYNACPFFSREFRVNSAGNRGLALVFSPSASCIPAAPPNAETLDIPTGAEPRIRPRPRCWKGLGFGRRDDPA